MASNFKIQNLPFLSLQVSQFSLKPSFSTFNFISRSTILPQFRVSIPFNKLHCLSLSSSPISVSENSSIKQPFEVSYLINKFGWPPNLAISIANHVNFNSPEKPDRVLAFFKKHGFTETQISDIVKRFPSFLLFDPEERFLPKLEFFSSLGLSTIEISDVVTKQPRTLVKDLEGTVLLNFNILRSLVNSDDEAVKVIKRFPIVLNRTPEEENVQILLEAGVPDANIIHYMTRSYREYLPSPDIVRKRVEEVKEMGFDPCSKKFLHALLASRYFGKSTLEDKVPVLKKYGWSDREILLAFEKYPRFIMASKDKIEGIMDFLVNRMGVEATDVADLPYVFRNSLEKKIVPRCLVLQSLLEKGLRKKKVKITTLLRTTEAEFLTRYVIPYENEAPELWDLYKSLMRQGSLSFSETSLNEHSFEVSYLINTFGWTPEVAKSKVKYLVFKTPEKPDRVLTLFKKHGFTESQISHIVERCPQLLTCNPEKTFLPKFDFLSSLGLSTTEITVAITKTPYFLTRSLENTIKPAFKHLRSLVNSDDVAVKMVIQSPGSLRYNTKDEDSSIESSFEVSYLINTFGWPPEVAISNAKNLKFETLEKPERMLAFLKNYGFTKTQISHIVKRMPTLLVGNPEETYLPKLEFLLSRGFSRTEVTGIVTKKPHILRSSLEKMFVPWFDLLLNLVKSNDEAVRIVKRYPILLTRNPEVDIVQILLEEGVPGENIVAYMAGLRGTVTPHGLRKMVEKAKEMGFNPCRKRFLQAIKSVGKSS